MQIRNSFVYDFGQDGIDAAARRHVNRELDDLPHPPVANGGEGLQVGGGTRHRRERALDGAPRVNLTAISSARRTLTCNNCMSSDTSADDSGARVTWSTGLATVQLRLITGRRGPAPQVRRDAIGAGQDLSGSFTDDIDAQTRSGAWDVGADEFGAGAGRMLVKSGLYTGNAIDNRAIYVGFQPDVVLIKRDQGSASGLDYFPQVRTSTMAGDTTKNMSFSGVATYAGGIQSLDATGFTIGTNPAVNTNGAPFYWVALKAAPGELEVGSYTGDGIDNRSITGIGFRPDYVMMLPAGAVDPVHRSSAMPGEMTLGIDSLIYATNAVQAFRSRRLPGGHGPPGEPERHDVLLRGRQVRRGADQRGPVHR